MKQNFLSKSTKLFLLLLVIVASQLKSKAQSGCDQTFTANYDVYPCAAHLNTSCSQQDAQVYFLSQTASTIGPITTSYDASTQVTTYKTVTGDGCNLTYQCVPVIHEAVGSLQNPSMLGANCETSDPKVPYWFTIESFIEYPSPNGAYTMPCQFDLYDVTYIPNVYIGTYNSGDTIFNLPHGNYEARTVSMCADNGRYRFGTEERAYPNFYSPLYPYVVHDEVSFSTLPVYNPVITRTKNATCNGANGEVFFQFLDGAGSPTHFENQIAIETNGVYVPINRPTQNGWYNNLVPGNYSIRSFIYALASYPNNGYVSCYIQPTRYFTIGSTNTSSNTTVNQAICSDQYPYNWNGLVINTSGTYTVHLTGVAGCDSTVTLNLSNKLNTTSTTNINVCSSQLPYRWNNNNYNTTGSYTIHLTNAAGCDSAATLNLTVNVATRDTIYDTACNKYDWYTGKLFSSGTYTWVGTSAAGCDSIIVLKLTILGRPESHTYVNSCGTYIWNGYPRDISGTYTWFATSAAGCDSTAYLHLTIVGATYSTTNVSICSNQFPYQWNGNSYQLPDTYQVTLTNYAGCDSIATLNLTQNNPTSTSTANVCDNLFPYVWNGVAFNNFGLVSVTLPNASASGCDSVAQLLIYPIKTSRSVQYHTACNSYTWNGVTYTTSGTYNWTGGTNAAGCDSTAILNLTIQQGPASTTNASICTTALPYVWNGNSYTATGIYTVNFPMPSGCDSLATLNLSVKNNYTITATAGSNGSISPNGNTTICSGNNQSYTITPTNGYFISSVLVDGISQGPVTTFTFNNVTANHTIAVTFSSSCQNTSSTNSLAICASQLPYSWNGLTFTGAGSQTAHITNALGCDSAATLNLTVKASPSVGSIKNSSGVAITSASMCVLQGTMNLYSSPPGGSWSSDNTAIATVSSSGLVTAKTNGTAIIKYSIVGANGCSNFSSVTINVAAIPVPGAITGATSLCVGSSTTYTTATTGGSWSSLGRLNINSSGVATGTSAGSTSVRYTVNNAFGCSNYRDFALTVNALPAIPSIAYAPGYANPRAGCPGGALGRNKTFGLIGTPSGGVWSATGAISITTPGGIASTTNATGPVSVTYTFTNANGCSNSRQMTGVVGACKGVNQQTNQNFAYSIYPNPAKGTIKIKLENLVGIAKATIVDMVGKQHKQVILGLGVNTIDISNLAKGMYLVQIASDQGNKTEKIIVE